MAIFGNHVFFSYGSQILGEPLTKLYVRSINKVYTSIKKGDEGLFKSERAHEVLKPRTTATKATYITCSCWL
jgi:hypothetical protein